MEKIKNVQINYSNLHTTGHGKSDVIESIETDFMVMHELFKNINNNIIDNENKIIHISYPLAQMITAWFNKLVEIKNSSVYVYPSSSFAGFPTEFNYLDRLFYFLDDFRWIVMHFPLDDSNSWVSNLDVNIKYHEIKTSITILNEIEADIIPAIYVSIYDPQVFYDKLTLLADINDNNKDGIFYHIIVHELDTLKQIFNATHTETGYDDIYRQLNKTFGLYQYISLLDYLSSI